MHIPRAILPILLLLVTLTILTPYTTAQAPPGAPEQPLIRPNLPNDPTGARRAFREAADQAKARGKRAAAKGAQNLRGVIPNFGFEH
ncbi:hypothetical protein HK097_001313 [Rhizophlyctis rosea]|uniref:Uncharacterized protein n=1 Tax=Rhizophlyctis rosea TaxID=64517 RepID=A0AAD5WYE1_9FUNG|nr:hypothetical protein HK097_001313 [Rhizophlyctis rosea]